jgi:hypothetical protein
VKPLEALRALGTGSEPPVETKQRVYASLLASLEGAAAAAALATAMPKAPATLPPTAMPALAGIASSKALLIAAGIWLIGGATGAALYGAFQREQVRVVYVDRPVVAFPTPALPATGTLPVAPASIPPSPPKAMNAARNDGSAPASSSAGSGLSELARERELLDRARAHAAQGEPALVLEEVEQHRRQFPHGRLAEEREALAIRALLALGRVDEAHARAAAFRARYPNSFLTPVIDSALSAP